MNANFIPVWREQTLDLTDRDVVLSLTVSDLLEILTEAEVDYGQYSPELRALRRPYVDAENAMIDFMSAWDRITNRKGEFSE